VAEEFIHPPEVAAITGLTVGALAQLRHEGRGPRFYKPTSHRILYKREEVIAWLETCAHETAPVPA
jgi:hypothetical protein